MITARDLKKVLMSPAYRKDMDEMSSYAANIMQERPMLLFLSKYLSQQGYEVALEKDKCDLVVNDTEIEFKFSYDFHVLKLQKEMDNFAGRLDNAWKATKAGQLTKAWTVLPRILQDVYGRSTDIFIWVVCARDLSRVQTDLLRRVCASGTQIGYNKNHEFNNRESMKVVDGFLTKVRRRRTLVIEKVVINTNGNFPASYQIRICDFQKT